MKLIRLAVAALVAVGALAVGSAPVATADSICPNGGLPARATRIPFTENYVYWGATGRTDTFHVGAPDDPFEPGFFLQIAEVTAADGFVVTSSAITYVLGLGIDPSLNIIDPPEPSWSEFVVTFEDAVYIRTWTVCLAPA